MRQNDTFTNARMAEMMHKSRIRPSVQRIAVLANIANKRKHPTADEIFNDLVAEYPSVSKTTVYNSLHVLVAAGIVRELEIESGNKRYDLAVQPSHGHFICRRCGRIFDIELPPGLDKVSAPGFSIDSMDVCFKGICQQCNQADPIT